ncbi:hypothetical protein CW745_15865 [Psychromonas sp. psych-6C06]|uniref:hypothetical protein n=1 Tax=Psychromonas sp. psych-6C06 TaxID=2058089 RepID=UPI000C3240AF|nr:hypothetical protein [Psychromonas sp. psych-6C06]PKF60320.1 hypothetical protein CW745_15865 [Psychromonas sp. psych-6C06]
MSLYKCYMFITCILFTPLSLAEWVDFEDLSSGKEFNYKPYASQEFEFKASRYFDGGTLFYYDFKIAANLGDSNQSENFLSIDMGSNSCAPGISIKHKEQLLFDFYAFDIGKIYDHDGEFSLNLLGLDREGKVIAEQLLVISSPLSRIELKEKFFGVHEVLINAVYVNDIDNSVARFALDNIDISPSNHSRKRNKLAL